MCFSPSPLSSSKVRFWCVLVWIFFRFICLVFAQFPESVGLWLSPSLRSPRPFFLRTFLQLHTLLSWDSNEKKVRFSITVHSLGVCVDLPSSFSLLFKLGNFYWYVFKFTDPFLCYYHLVLRPFGELLFQLLYSIYNFYLVHFYISYFLAKIYHFFPRMTSCLQKHFYDN